MSKKKKAKKERANKIAETVIKAIFATAALITSIAELIKALS